MKPAAPIRRALRVALAATLAVALCYFAIVAGIVLFGIDSLSYKLMVQWLPALLGRL